MDKEIKEILEDLQKCINDEQYEQLLKIEHIKVLLDYITNLQEENENLRDFNSKLLSTKDRLDKYDRENQLKIDKAIKYFKYQLEFLDFEKDIKARMLCSMGIVLLQGSDKE